MNAHAVRRLEPAAWALLCAAVYIGFGADGFYKTDGIDIVRLLDGGEPHPWHVGYLPALRAFRWLCDLVGLHPGYLQLGVWFSAVLAALGVGCVRAGLDRLGTPPAVARLATAAFGFGAGVLTFATVVEFHGPMLGPLGLAFWWTCVLCRKPSWGGMVLLGALCHLPFLIHSQQLFLPAWLLPFFLSQRRPLTRIDLGRALVAGAVHATLVLVLPRVLPSCYGFWADLGTGLRTESSIGRPQSLDYLPNIFMQEWLWPLLPLSVFAFTAVLRRALWAEFAAFAVGMVPYLWLSVRQLVHEPEYGAYMLPMTLPAAMLMAKRFGGRRIGWIALLLGVYMWQRGPCDHLRQQATEDDLFALRVRQAAAAARPFVLVGSHRELGSAYARLLPDEILWVRQTATLPREQAGPERFAGMELYLKKLLGEGRAVLVTASAIDSLRDPAGAMRREKATLEVPANDTMAGPLFAERLLAAFQLELATTNVFRLVPK